MKIYTGTGDDGTTSMARGPRLPKHHPRVDACGSVDELIAWIGLLRSFPELAYEHETLVNIQDQLMRSACILARPGENPETIDCNVDDSAITFLEGEIDKIGEKLPPIDSFILPGGNLPLSYCNIARSVCRRAERSVTRLRSDEYVPEIICTYLNRLSDYLFTLTRKIGYDLDTKEIRWPTR